VTFILPPGDGALTDEEVEELRIEMERTLRRPVMWRGPDGKVRRRLPLPLKTRMRLRSQRRVDRVCAWLCGIHCERIAGAIWKTMRMMKLCRSSTCPGCTARWDAGTPCT
jgi:hypothetical protein